MTTHLTKLLALAILAAGIGAASPALAHPHVYVAVRSEIVFAPDGKITGVRHSWTFDEMYSAFAVQGMVKEGKTNQSELNELASLLRLGLHQSN